MSEEESAKAKPEPARSPSPPLARPAPGATPATPAASPVKVRPPLGAALGASPFRPSATALGGAVSPKGPPIAPRPPVASVPDAAPSEPTAGGEVTAVTTALPRSALDSQVADLVAWRREAEKKLAHLESELQQLKRTGVAAPAPFAPATFAPATFAPAPLAQAAAVRPVDLQRDPTAPLFPEHDRGEPETAPDAAASPAPVPRGTMPSEDLSIVRSSLVTTIAPREPRRQFELDMRPGEYLDMPSELDGGKRRRLLAGLAVFVMVAGMAALVITALASQR